jgi:hypothetical protein
MLVLIKNRALLCAALSFLCSKMLNAQIEKGTTFLSGGIQMVENLGNSSSFNGNSLSLNPSFGRFITDKIMIKGRLESAIYNAFGNDYGGVESYYKSTRFSVLPELRYYFNPKAKWQYFGGVSAGITAMNYDSKFNELNYKGSSLGFTGSIFGGVNRFLNNEIAIEGKLGYSFSSRQQPDVLAISHNSQAIGLDVSFNSYVSFSPKKEGNLEGLIEKGRTVIGGRLAINNFTGQTPFGRREGSYAILDAEYGKFVKKGLLVGGKTHIGFDGGYGSTANASLYSQYFYPISNRFMLHAKGELQYNFAPNNNYLSLKGSLGATYFLSKNVALDFNILNLSKSFIPNTNFRPNTIGSSIGLRYFLK